MIKAYLAYEHIPLYVCVCMKLYIYITELTSECVRRRKIKLVILSAAEMSKNICTFWQIMTIKILQIVITTSIYYMLIMNALNVCILMTLVCIYTYVVHMQLSECCYQWLM